MSKMVHGVVALLLPVALVLLLSAGPAQAQCRGGQYRGQQVNMMGLRQQPYGMFTGLQQQQQYALLAWQQQQQQQYALLLALQQQQYALQQRALAAQLLGGR